MGAYDIPPLNDCLKSRQCHRVEREFLPFFYLPKANINEVTEGPGEVAGEGVMIVSVDSDKGFDSPERIGRSRPGRYIENENTVHRTS